MTDRQSGSVTTVLAAGVTHTAAIPGISAAGADPDTRRWTPTADVAVLATGEPRGVPGLPRSPTGCPTPAVVTRAVREAVGFDLRAIDAGLVEAPASDVADAGPGEMSASDARQAGAVPGGDIRDVEPVASAAAHFERGRAVGNATTADHLLLAETVPGGTTTAMGVLAALGERTAVSSSLHENPISRKRSAVRTGLAASDLDRGDLAGRPRAAVRHMGDPVLGTLAGVVLGAPEDVRVTLAGGTQLGCVGALARHAGVDRSLELATASYVAADETADVAALAADLDLALRVNDPGFDETTYPGLARYAEGEAKEGVGMGGALALADDRGVPMATVRERAVEVLDRCLAETA